ncbi:MAG: DNA-binding response regulator [Marivirga sp.]|nr:DNA-binding response regulator [Marivirga sp.]
MKIKCIIVDDEPPARQLLRSYISRLENFDIVGQFENSLEAFSFLQNVSIDLMFLDIQMPGMSGLELIRSLHHVPPVILTTAYREYATEGFDLDVIDYLVKPVSFERFMKAVSKYHQQNSRISGEEPVHVEPKAAYLFIKVNKEQVKVFLDDIVYIESIKDYLRIHTKSKSFITYLRLNYMLEKLPDDGFIRIHKSYIVSVKNIRAFRGDSVRVGEKELPVGRFFKKNFLASLANRAG